jgi:hypothetical protein
MSRTLSQQDLAADAIVRMPVDAAADDVKSVSTARAVFNNINGEIRTNYIMGPTVFSFLGKYSPEALEAILGFFKNTLQLGDNAAIYLPLLINVVPVFLGLVKSSVQAKRGTLNDEANDLVHTPFPMLAPVKTTEAVFGNLLMCVAQMMSNAMLLYPHLAGKKTSEVVTNGLYSDPLFTFYGQLVAVRLAYALLFIAAPLVAQKTAEVAVSAATTVSNAASGLWQRVTASGTSDSENAQAFLPGGGSSEGSMSARSDGVTRVDDEEPRVDVEKNRLEVNLP